MSIGSNIPPYPKRCGEIGCVFGSARYVHTIRKVIAAKYVNSTQYEVDGVTGSPVPLWYATDECGVPQSAPFVSQLGDVLDEVMNGYQFTGNAFTADGNVDMTPACRLAGFKSAQAQKLWPGSFGFLYNPSTGKDCATNTTATGTKYLAATFDVTLTSESVGDPYYNPAFAYDIALAGDIAFDSQTGLYDDTSLIITGTETQYDGFPVGNPYIEKEWTGKGAGTSTLLPSTVTTYTSGFASRLDSLVGADYSACSGLPVVPENTFGNTGGGSPQPNCTLDALIAWWAATYGSEASFVALDAVTDENSYSDTATFTTSAGLTPSITLSWTRTNTVLLWNFVFNDGGTFLGGTGGIWEFTFAGSITLSDTYTLAQVKSDAEILADEIDLDDNAASPYRTDENSFIAPLVVSNEVRTVRGPLGIGYATNSDGDPLDGERSPITGAVYSSDIIGALLPSGYGQGSPRGVFRITHENFYRSICGTPPTEAIGQRTMGKWTPSYLPANCGLWTQDNRFINTITANLMWPCAFIVANTDGIYLQKWKETIIPPPNGSYNAARPYGKDRFRIDETQVYCYEAGYIRDQASDPIVSTTFSGLWGGISVDGFYSGCSTDVAGVLTLGTKVLDVPTGWTVPSEDEDDIFAKLRWEDATKHVPGFGGKLDVTATYDSGPDETTFTYTGGEYIVGSDKVSVMGFGDAILGTNLSITRLGDTSLKVSGDYSDALWLVPYKLFDGTTDGTKYYFANDTHKSTFVARTWALEMDGWTVTDSTVEQDCIPITNCSPQTLLASPNTDSADYAMDWPTTIDPNTVWIGQFMQWMVDPFYQTPHPPCGGGPAPDTTCKVPYIEARIAVGTNYGLAQNETAPTPPSPINLGATVAPPDVADLSGTGAVVDLLNNPTTPFPIFAACGDDPVAT